MTTTTALTDPPQLPTITPATGGTVIGPTIAISVAWCDPDDQLAGHDVFLDGQPLSTSYDNRTQTGCVGAGTSSAPNVVVSTGSHTLMARATDAAGHVTETRSTFTVSLPPLTDFRPEVTPAIGSGATLEVPLASAPRVSFGVKNAGTRTAAYQLSATCGAATGCQVTPTTLTLAPGATDSARVSFNAPTTSGVTTGIAATARYQNTDGYAIADSGRITTSTLVVPLPFLARAAL